MVSGHPHIKRAYMREGYCEQGTLHRKLVIDTLLYNPEKGNLTNRAQWAALQDYLGTLAANNFIDIGTIEMRCVTEH